jgi:hypothetical protein
MTYVGKVGELVLPRTSCCNCHSTAMRRCTPLLHTPVPNFRYRKFATFPGLYFQDKVNLLFLGTTFLYDSPFGTITPLRNFSGHH